MGVLLFWQKCRQAQIAQIESLFMKRPNKRSAFADYIVADLLSGVNDVRARSMFGGHGLYQDEVFFAIIVDEELYFKVDDSNRRDYESAESQPFTYEVSGRKKPVVMSYWKVPADILEDRDSLAEWANQSIAVAKKAKTSRSVRD